MFNLALTYAIFACLIFIFVETRMKNPILAIFVKALASLGFIMIASASIYLLQTSHVGDIGFISEQSKLLKVSLFIFLGLTLGLIGDLVLAIRPLQTKEKDKTIIIYGILSFSLGHVFYLIALFTISEFGIFSVMIGLFMTVVIVIMSNLLGFEMGKAKIPSFFYAFLIFMMVGQTLKLGFDHNFTFFSVLFIIGALLFALSDLILSPIYFKNMNSRKMIALNLATYYAAQIFIASSILYLF